MATGSPLSREQATDFAFDIYRAVADAMARFGVVNRNSAAFPAMMALRINDGLAAVATLICSNGQAHAPTITRSMIESLLDLTLLVKCAEYRKPLLLASLQATHRYVELGVGARETEEQIRERLRGELRTIGAQIKELESQGVQRMEIGEKLRQSGQEPKLLYYIARFHCSAHGSLGELVDRHFRDDEFQIGDTLEDWQALEILSIACAVAAEVLTFVPHFSPCTASEASALHDALLPKVRALATGTAGDRDGTD